jgi:RNA-binding protein YhbY
MTAQIEIQLGKKGLTKEFLDGLKIRMDKKEVKNIKIHVLPSARESREDVKKFSEEILKFLGNKYSARIIGFSIFVKKWRREYIKEGVK